MKPPAKQLLDDLLEDSAPPEFRSGVMEKTLIAARRRRRVRRFNLVLGMIGIVGILVFGSQIMRERTKSPFNLPITWIPIVGQLDEIGITMLAVGAWLGPEGFTKGWCENFEFKKLMNGDLGVATGEPTARMAREMGARPPGAGRRDGHAVGVQGRRLVGPIVVAGHQVHQPAPV